MEHGTGKLLGIRPRRVGWVFLVIMFPVVIAAWNTGINILYLIACGLITFFVLSFFLSRSVLRNITLHREAPTAVFRRQKFRVHARIKNNKRLLPAVSLRVESSAKQGGSLGYVMKLSAQHTIEISIEDVFEKRGVYQFPPFDVVTSFPFGLLERRCRYADNAQVVVYPRVVRVRASVIEQMPSARNVSRVASPDGDEFYSLREYVLGDDMRHISWRLSARLGVWIIREMSRDNSRFVVLVLDSRQPEGMEDFEERFEEAVEVVASLAVTLLGRQFDVAVEAPGVSVESGEGKSQERRILEMLARVNPVPAMGYDGFDGEVHTIESRQASVLYISPDPARWGERRGRGNLRVLDPRELVHG